MSKRGMMLVAAALVIAAASLWTKPAAAQGKATDQVQLGAQQWTLAGDAERFGGPEHYRGSMTDSQFEAYRLERMKEMATYFGIETAGKTADQLKVELKAAKEKDSAKWEAFKAQHLAKRLDHLRQLAKERGIETEGKSAEQLHQELRKAGGDKGPNRFGDHRKEKPQPAPSVQPTVQPQPTPGVKPSVAPQPTPKTGGSEQTPGGKTKMEAEQGGKSDKASPIGTTQPKQSGTQSQSKSK
ncbi:hypothetical protein ACX93W_17150 [Paenibacillus sp. CAU 1782]